MQASYRNKLKAKPDGINSNGWADRHFAAAQCPQSEYEKALVEMLSGWLRYADAVASGGQSGIGQDYALGPCWARIGDGLRGLLNGETGRFDCGTLDGILCRCLEAENFDPANL